MPTDVGAPSFDLDRPWVLHPQAQVRPERFGALLYHFGTRRLSFLKHPRLLAVVRALENQPSARAACVACGVTDDELPSYSVALERLAQTAMIQERAA